MFSVRNGAEAEHAAKIVSFVGGALSSSARAPLSGQLATFSHAIDAPSAQLRIQVGSLTSVAFMSRGKTCMMKSD